jgi:2-desacetyl-2-hydroxyethyl bacteriochlorophyllide A dehydrogenase
LGFRRLDPVPEYGWGLHLLNLGQAGPVESFLPVLMLAVLFGLSMDYEVFLVSRIREEWAASGDNRQAVRTGQATTGRVIIAAATIMICVFSAFILSSQQTGRPVPGPRDVLLRVRACGICGTDAIFVQIGGMPLGPGGQITAIPLGHELAGETIETGAQVTGLKPGDRVVINPQAAPSGIIGCGGVQGGMSEYLLIENARAGTSLAVFPDTVPFEIAALNEPMAVARHCVNRSQARIADKVAVFGAGPIGLGTVIWLKLAGVRHVAVADIIPGRLQTALDVGADAVIDSSREDVTARLTDLHGHSTNAVGQPRPDTGIYIDADPGTGAASVVSTALRAAKWGARLVTVAVHSKPEPIDLGAMLRSEVTIIASQGYLTEIFEIIPQIAEYQQRFSRLISHRVPFCEVTEAFQLALTPGAAEKVVVTFND